MPQKLDSKGRVVIPQDQRSNWNVEQGDTVHVLATSPTGQTASVRDTVDSRGRITIPKEQRERLVDGSNRRFQVDVLGVNEGGYECDDCDNEFDLGKVLILNGGERVVCASCSKPEDRVV